MQKPPFKKIQQGLLYLGLALLLVACGGGGSTETAPNRPDPVVTTVRVGATVVKGLVEGANCNLFAVPSGEASTTALATGSTTAGVVDFGNSIEHEGTTLISCSGGTYTDEATGTGGFAAPTLRAVVDIDGNGSFTVSPLTEIATRRAENASDLGTALTTHNSGVASAFGLTADITAIVPTDINNTAAANNNEGHYASALALISQLNENEAGDLNSVITNLTTDLNDDGNFSTATLANLSTAESDLASSAVAGTLSFDSLAVITASAGITEEQTEEEPDSDSPNILVIISDDQGVDASAEYDFSLDPPTTPTISGLAANGVVFQNAWAAPACAPTRAAILTGKHGVNNGVLSVPGDLNESDVIIHEFLAADADTNSYATAFIGKWHLAGGTSEESNPVDNGVGYFAGSVRGNVDDYNSWDLTIDSDDTSATTSTSTEYNTNELTDLAEDWIAAQNSPWMLTLAYNAPHSPLHWPDPSLHDRGNQYTTEQCSASNATSTIKRTCFLAMIEAMDAEIGNLLDSMSAEERNNTVILFVGDNGTGNGQRDTLVFNAREVKGTLFEGGVRVPLVVSGAGVSRSNVTEERLVTVTDIYATVAELAGSKTTSIHDSLSFAGYLASVDGETRQYAYSDYRDGSVVDGWTVRNLNYQLINNLDVETLYQLNSDNFNTIDVTANEPSVLYELQVEAAKIRGELGTLSVNANEQGSLDISDDGDNALFSVRASTCVRFVKEYSSTVTNLDDNSVFNGDLAIGVAGGKCLIDTNNIPNHDMHEGGRFANPIRAQSLSYEIPAAPEFTPTATELGLGAGAHGIFLNGVKIDILAAACLGLESEAIGCGANTFSPEDEWRFDPMYQNGGFNTDVHNAHTQPSGAYHYHGNPNALFDQSGNFESGTIGFAADGFPIYGSYIRDNGQVRKVTPSYQLKSGNRPDLDYLGFTAPNYSEVPYDGTFRQDYEYVEGLGDLDECNGMTVDGEYGYYVTDGFPYILGCFKGSPDSSFSPSRP